MIVYVALIERISGLLTPIWKTSREALISKKPIIIIEK